MAPEWPSDSAIPRNEQGWTLVLFAHPCCPCTRVTLGELERIVARFPDTLAIPIVLLTPTEEPPGWDPRRLMSAIAAIPGTQVIHDTDGAETRRFHATTSGHVFLYDRNGQLQFNGGITFARGHAGDNPGRAAIEACLAGRVVHDRQTPVFGCPMTTSSSYAPDAP